MLQILESGKKGDGWFWMGLNSHGRNRHIFDPSMSFEAQEALVTRSAFSS